MLHAVATRWRSAHTALALAALTLGAFTACGSTSTKPDDASPGTGGHSTGGQPAAGSAGAPHAAPRRPFTASVEYVAGAIGPSVDRAELAAATGDFYDEWKARYVRRGCGQGRYYVATALDDIGNRTLSEGIGYGMVVTAYLAGHDPEAKTIFDGLYRLFRDHPAASSDDLMAWYLDEDCEPRIEGVLEDVSQSDGDLDIAYGLLLAHEQWGSCGAIDYHAEALRVIAAIADHELAPDGRFVRVGDWPTEAPWTRTMRSSDFMPGHFAAFAAATGEPMVVTAGTGGAGNDPGDIPNGGHGASPEGAAGAFAGVAGGHPLGEAGAPAGAAGAHIGAAGSPSFGAGGAGGAAGAHIGAAGAPSGIAGAEQGTWGSLLAGLSASFAQLQARHAPSTGLLPNYVFDPVTAPAPATTLPVPEGIDYDLHDDDYSWIACRVPWRVGVHYVTTGDARARALLQPFNAWARRVTDGDPLAFAAGYALDGTPLPAQDFASMAFIAPLGVSAMVDARNQAWLDALWHATVAFDPEDYYSDSIKLLSMIAMAHGWWSPSPLSSPADCRN